jgi:hypothetical protein
LARSESDRLRVDQTFPYDDDRAGELLVRAVKQAGAGRLAEPLALVGAVPAGRVHAVDQPGPTPGLMAISAASDRRRLLEPADQDQRAQDGEPGVGDVMLPSRPPPRSARIAAARRSRRWHQARRQTNP